VEHERTTRERAKEGDDRERADVERATREKECKFESGQQERETVRSQRKDDDSKRKMIIEREREREQKRTTRDRKGVGRNLSCGEN